MASPPSAPYNNDYVDIQPYDSPFHPEEQYQTSTPPPPPPPVHRSHPAAHPSSSFNQMQNERQYAIPQQEPQRVSPPRAIMTQGHPVSRKALSPPPQQPQFDQDSANGQGHLPEASYTTPGTDNLGPAAVGGGIAGVAYDVAHQNQRESGVQALHDTDDLYHAGPSPPNDTAHGDDGDHSIPYASNQGGGQPLHPQGSSSSVLPLAAAAYTPGQMDRGQMTPHSNYSGPTLHPDDMPGGARQMNNYNVPNHYPQRSSWYDNPYEAHSISRASAGMNDIDPDAIADDGDDGLEYAAQHPKRKSMLGFGHNRSGSSLGGAAAGAAAGGTAGALAAGMEVPQSSGSGMFGNPGNRDASGTYTPVPGGAAPSAAGSNGGNPFEGTTASKELDSDWLASQTKGRKKMRWIVGSIVGVVLILAIVGGVVGGILGSRKNSSNSSSGGGSGNSAGGGMTASQDDGKGDLGKDSAQIQALMNNKNLHQVFPGIDYTPINTQYPACLTVPPSQNNVTRDLAVLSQLTNTLRLYGTDCNQTEMVLHSVSRLELTDMKIWLGVWLGNNDTTNTRQLNAMWSLLDQFGSDPFAGLAIGNEVLFRKDLTAAQLGSILTGVKQNLTSKNIDLPVATSDLGSNWNTQLASEVDIVMANVHPFFGGSPADQAAAWTWTFWQGNDVAVSGGKKNIISEVGWPSGGGNDCGVGVTCPSATAGSVAGISEMNLFMSEWVCQSMANGTDYFWFEAFDEPWKFIYNTPSKGENWEDKWGLMDVNRNLKPGVVIPDCGGKTVSRR